MGIALKTHKMLWGRAAARCSMPECRRRLVEDILETDDPTLVGENCHIVAEKDGGPRGDVNMPVDDRNRYGNLILLCSVHHKIIDDNENKWNVNALIQLKRQHELWVEQSLGLDEIKLREDTIYADYIDEWAKLAHLDNWLAWSSYILGSGQPRISVLVNNDIEKLRRWMLGRVWPKRYTKLEDSFKNFKNVLDDFHETLCSHLIKEGNIFFTEKFYKIDDWNPRLYEQLLSQYNFHVDIICDLMLELTRAANLVCDEVRSQISYNYRIKEGYLIVQRGPNRFFQFEEFTVNYKIEEIQKSEPYPGLDKFFDDRANRDWTIGKGRPLYITC